MSLRNLLSSFILCLGLILSGCSLVNVKPQFSDKEVLEKISNTFKNTKFHKVEFQGNFELWRVYYRGKDNELKILYYEPSRGYLFFGEIWTVNGTSITANDIESEEKRK
ncbi:MAG: hypothetical protein QXT86_12370 [Archaeoglobaceae archaeon]